MLRLLPFLLLFASCTVSQSNPSRTSAAQKQLLYQDAVYEPHIRSVQLHLPDSPLNFPILRLGEPSQILLGFDELVTEQANLSDFWIEAVHCDADWRPTGTLPLEFLNGISTDRIYDYNRSVNTHIPYVHYAYRFPAEGTTFTKSGNYLLKVFRGGNENDLVLSRRFVVAGRKTRIELPFEPRSSFNFRNKDRSTAFSVLLNGKIGNALDLRQELQVKVVRNFHWEDAVQLQPISFDEQRFDFTFYPNNEFEGGHEFRRVDLRPRGATGTVIDAVEDRDSITFVRLETDQLRRRNSFETYADLNGQFVTGTRNDPSAHFDEDYVLVHFSLERNTELPNARVFVTGAFSNGLPEEDNEMTYNAVRRRYETELLLKAGIHDYKYQAVDERGRLQTDLLEPQSGVTENFYTILVYWKPFGARGAELIAVRNLF